MGSGRKQEPGLITVVPGFDGKIRYRLLHQGNGVLKHIPLGSRHPDSLTLDGRLNLELRVLDQLDDFLGQFTFDTDLELQILLDLVS